MDFLNTDSLIGIVLIIGWLLVGATVGITLMALAASELMRFFFSSFGDRDEEISS